MDSGAGVPTGAPNGAMASCPYFIAASGRPDVRFAVAGAGHDDNRLRHALMLERPAHIERRRLDDVADVEVGVTDANLAGENHTALGAKIVNSRRQVRRERAVGLGRRDVDIVGDAILVMKLAPIRRLGRRDTT